MGERMMKLFNTTPVVYVGALACLFFSSLAMAQLPSHTVTFSVDSRLLTQAVAGKAAGVEGPSVFTEVIRADGAPWLRVHISEYNLGQQSYITFTSVKDGGRQRLDSKTLPQWGNTSAYLNGDAVEVALHVAPGEQGIFFRVDEITVGEWYQPPLTAKTICGTDDRVPSSDARTARLTFVNVLGNPGSACTAWLVSNGALLTAGHCVDFDPDRGGPLLPDGVLDLDNNDVIEFAVPASLADGTLVFANPDDQYAIDLPTVAWGFDGAGQGLGKDWAALAVFPNPNTGLTPFQAQGAFFRMTNANPAVGNNIQITGYGTDNTPNLTRNQIQQTQTGPYVGESSSGANFWHRYATDTTGGNSGSPIIWNSSIYTVGIHTNGGCTATGGNNAGTSFEHNPLETALENFPGANTVFTDLQRWGASENGTVFHPYDTLGESVGAVPSALTMKI